MGWEGGDQKAEFLDPRPLFDAEKKLREAATGLQLNGVLDVFKVEDAIWLLRDAVSEASSRKDDVASMGIDEQVDRVFDIDNYIGALKTALRALDELYFSREGRREKNPAITEEEESALDQLEKKVVELTGKKCRFRASNRLSSALNDLAACVHRLAEYASKKFEARGLCLIVEDGSGRELCAAWSDAVEKNNYNLGIYSDSDFGELMGWVVGDKVYLKVGSANEHRAHIDLSSGELVYYDDDMPVNRVVKRLLESYAGLSCRVVSGSAGFSGVQCRGVSERNAEKVGRALSLATSMDFRIGDISDWWGTEYSELGEYTMALQWLRDSEKMDKKT